MPFHAVSLLLLDPVAERVLAAWPLVRRARGGGEWSMGGWLVDEPELRRLAEGDAVTLTDTLARLSAMDLLDGQGDLRSEVLGYLGRRVAARLKQPVKAASTR